MTNERSQTHTVVNAAIHRAVEFHAAARPDAVALVDLGRSLTYRELNARANVVARALMAHGLRRGNAVLVRMPCSAELAVVLLAILKAGAAYCWIDPERMSSWPQGVSILTATRGNEQRAVAVDLMRVLAHETRVTPNLPVMTRATDAACLVPDGVGNPAMTVTHGALATLQDGNAPLIEWSRDASPFLLWVGLLSGASVSIVADAAVVAA